MLLTEAIAILHIEITTECDRNCPFCYNKLVSRPLKTMTKEDIKEIVETFEYFLSLAKQNISILSKRCFIVGGEPSIKEEELFYLLRLLQEKDYSSVSLFTNANRLSTLKQIKDSFSFPFFGVGYNIGTDEKKEAKEKIKNLEKIFGRFFRPFIVLSDENLDRVLDFVEFTLTETEAMGMGLVPPLQEIKDVDKYVRVVLEAIDLLKEVGKKKRRVFDPAELFVQGVLLEETHLPKALLLQLVKMNFERLPFFAIYLGIDVEKYIFEFNPLVKTGKTLNDLLSLPFLTSHSLVLYPKHLYPECSHCRWKIFCKGNWIGGTSSFILFGDSKRKWILCDIYREKIWPSLYEYLKIIRETEFYLKRTRNLGYDDIFLKRYHKFVDSYVEENNPSKVAKLAQEILSNDFRLDML